VPAPIPNGRQRGDNRGAGQSADDHTIAEADPRPTASGLLLYTLNIFEIDVSFVQGDVRAVVAVSPTDLLEVLAKDLGANSLGYLAP
jgi:hypothetical protein